MSRFIEGEDRARPWTGDFDQMLERRLIRVHIPYSRSLYFIDKGHERGLSVELVIGWDFPLTDELVLRPIFNFSLGHIESDLALGERVVESRLGVDIDFLENGRLNTYGLGGSLMLDYERYRPENEIDVELRYTNVYLQSYGGSSDAVQGSASAQSLALWSRWRAPTGLTALARPLRYVLEFAHTQFLGDLRGTLGFNSLTSLGAGLELGSSKYDIVVTRTRLLGRFQFGEGVRGWSVSF
jgi:hypothetical protein